MAKVSDIGLNAGIPIPGLSKDQGPQTTAGGDAFSDIMDRAREAGKQSDRDLMDMAKPSDDNSKKAVQGSQNKATGRSDDAAKASDAKKTDAQDKKVSDDKNVKNSSKAEAADGKKAADPNSEKAVDEAQEKIISETAEKLGISEDELLSMMEILGLTVADLAQAGNVAAIVADMNQISSADIVVSEELTGLVKDVAADVAADLAQAADELGMSTEELMDQIRSQAAANAETSSEPVAETFAESTGDAFAPVETLAAEKSDKAISEVDDEDAAIEDLADADNAAQTAGQGKTVQNTGTQESESGNAKQKGREGRHDNAQTQTEAVNAQPAQVPVSQTAMRNAEGPVETFEQRLNARQTQEVIDQIAEHARISGGDRMTSMELMLNPANLGSIRLQLQSDNGVIKGQLTASDEAVKAALESQLQQLRDSLIEQGVKVEAIEVTVAGHELEQNLDQSGQQAERDAEDMAARKNPRRILDLNEEGVEDTIEQMTDAERLEVEMMRMGGNRLNYQA